MDPYLSSPNNIICKNCGAEFDSALPNCPYCGRMNLPAAEKEYMSKLETIRGDLEDLGNIGTRKAMTHTRALLRIVLPAAAGIILLIIVILGIHAHRVRADADKGKAEYLWQREAFAQMDEYYAAGNYDQLYSAYSAALEEGHQVYQYRHYAFCDYLANIRYAEQSLKDMSSGYGSNVFLFKDEISLYGLEYQSNISEDERMLLEQMRAPLLEDFESRFQLSEDELAYFQKMLKKDGFVPFSECEKFLKERGVED